MFPFGKKPTEPTARDLRAKRRSEQKASSLKPLHSGLEDSGLKPPSVSVSESKVKNVEEIRNRKGGPAEPTTRETLRDQRPLGREVSLPAYLDLAAEPTGERNDSQREPRLIVQHSSSGTLDRPTTSRPAIVNVRSRQKSPESPRRSVDSLVQHFSPTNIVRGRVPIQTLGSVPPRVITTGLPIVQVLPSVNPPSF